MVRDRDGLSEQQVAALEANPRFRCLGRRHIENYFLNEDVLVGVAKHLYLDAHMQDRAQIEQALTRAATSTLNTALLQNVREYVRVNGSIEVPKLRALDSKGIDEIEEELVGLVASECSRLGGCFSPSSIAELVHKERTALQGSFANGAWRTHFPGKLVFAKFCGEFWCVDAGRIREAYVDLALEYFQDALADLVQIAQRFAEL